MGDRKIRPYFSSPCFNEKVFLLKRPAPGILQELKRHGFFAGIPLGDFYPQHPDFKNALLICVTEKHPRNQIEAMVSALSKVN